MARIKGRTRADTCSAVLASAEWAFARYGFRGASMQVIATRANVTPATICYYFQDKAGLFDAVIDAIYARAVGLTQALHGEAPLDELIEEIYGFAEQNRDALRLILGHIVEEGGLDPTTRDVRMTGSLGLIAPVVAKRFDVSTSCAREALVCLNHLIMPFVTNQPDDNRVALDAKDTDEARARILSLLGSVARHLLQLPPKK